MLFRSDFYCNALCDLGASSSIMPKSLYDMLYLKALDESILGVHLIDSTVKITLGRIDNVLIISNYNYVPCLFSCFRYLMPCLLSYFFGIPFLCTVGAIIVMKEGIIRFQFPLKKGMENFPRNIMKLPFESIVRESYNSIGNT